MLGSDSVVTSHQLCIDFCCREGQAGVCLLLAAGLLQTSLVGCSTLPLACLIIKLKIKGKVRSSRWRFFE
jgi:hypothetical protein